MPSVLASALPHPLGQQGATEGHCGVLSRAVTCATCGSDGVTAVLHVLKRARDRNREVSERSVIPSVTLILCVGLVAP